MTRVQRSVPKHGYKSTKETTDTSVVSKITMNKEREIDSIEIQINNDVITYLIRMGYQRNTVTHPFCICLE